MPPEVSQTVSVRGHSSTRGPHFLARVLQEMRSGWSSNTVKPHAEDFFAKFPELTELPETALRVILEEVSLRRQSGEEVALGEFFNRFPQWQMQLSGLIGAAAAVPMLPAFAESGQIFANFELLDVVGQGAEGKVFLARQLDLSDRLVVLKIVAKSGQEHLSLARLQHSHIVPLYGVFEEERQRALCMPFFGRTTAKHLLTALEKKPAGERTGQDILAAIDGEVSDPRLVQFRASTSRLFLAQVDYVKAWCWIGACLADALHYAHERNLVHFDIKPSNVLLAADGLPMLLDFHLARPPLSRGDCPPLSLGGTRAYMPPEQKRACDDIRLGRNHSCTVDGRADIYSLGVLLYEALGNGCSDIKDMVPLGRLNPRVTHDLERIVHTCLAENPDERYASARDLAMDLRRHMDDLPLKIAGNSPLTERWSKWRRRHPYHLPILALTVVCLAALGTLGVMGVQQVHLDRCRAEENFFQGQQLLLQRQYAQAIDSLSRGLELAGGWAGNNGLREGLVQHLRLAERSMRADQLHKWADHLRFLALTSPMDQRTLVVLEVGCKQTWAECKVLAEHPHTALDPVMEQSVRRDLVDLASCWAQVRRELAGTERADKGRKDAAEVYDMITKVSGPSTLLSWERGLYEGAVGVPPLGGHFGAAQIPPQGPVPTDEAWDFYCQGRSLLRINKITAALQLLEKSLQLDPANFWTNFTMGVCCQQLGRYQEAITPFSVCLGQEPLKFQCYLRRAQVYAALGAWDSSLRDVRRGLVLKPNQTQLLLERGKAQFHLGDLNQACADILQVLAQDSAVSAAHLYLAKIHVARNEFGAARSHLHFVMTLQPGHEEARSLLEKIGP